MQRLRNSNKSPRHFRFSVLLLTRRRNRGGQQAVSLTGRVRPDFNKNQFAQRRVGLHHLCFHARERGDLYSFDGFLRESGAKIVDRTVNDPAYARAASGRPASGGMSGRVRMLNARPAAISAMIPPAKKA